MIKSIEVSAKTEDEAIKSALEKLGLSRDDVSVEIVERAKSGFFGLKSSPAVVRVNYEVEDDLSIEANAEAMADVDDSVKESKSITQNDEQDDRCANAKRFLSGLFERMGVDITAEITSDDSTIEVLLKGENPGSVIGRRGETLDAIQHLTNYVINRPGGKRTRVNIDAENYRQRRNETLEKLAERAAGKVLKYRKNVTLDPMNAYERHVIHTVLQEYDNISTYSVGNEPNRRIVVAQKGEGGRPARRQP